MRENRDLLFVNNLQLMAVVVTLLDVAKALIAALISYFLINTWCQNTSD